VDGTAPALPSLQMGGLVRLGGAPVLDFYTVLSYFAFFQTSGDTVVSRGNLWDLWL
jgi:hypothetical protein